MTVLMAQIDGKTYPLDECGWLQRKPCGCIVAALVAVPARGTAYATAEQAHKHLRPNKRSRDKDTREGLTFELITMAHYREHIGAKWECDQHRKAVS